MGTLEKKAALERLTFISDDEGKQVSPLMYVGQEGHVAGAAENEKQSADLSKNRTREEKPFSRLPLEEEDVIVDHVDETGQQNSTQPTVNHAGANRFSSRPLQEEEDVIVDDITETQPRKLSHLVVSSVKTETPFSRRPLEEVDVFIDNINETGQKKSDLPVVNSVALKASVSRLPLEEEDVIVDNVYEARPQNLTQSVLGSGIPETLLATPLLAEEDVIVDNIVETELPANSTVAEKRAIAPSHLLRGEKDVVQGRVERNISLVKTVQQGRFDRKHMEPTKTLRKTLQPYATSVSGTVSNFLQKASSVVRGAFFLADPEKASDSEQQTDGTVFTGNPAPNSIPTTVADNMPTIPDTVQTRTSSFVTLPLNSFEETNHVTAPEVARATPREELERPTLQHEERYAPVKYAPELSLESEENLPDFETNLSIDGTGMPSDDERIHQFQNHYQEWVYVILESMYGTDWDSENPAIRETRECSEKRLKNRGCALLVPACKKYTTPPGGWSCEMSLWRACSCSVPYKSFLKYLIPPASECYGEVLHPSDVLRLKHTRIPFDPLVDTSSQVLIPTGYCGWSGFFAFYIIMVATLIIAFIGVLHRFARRALKGKPFAALARVKRVQKSTTAVTMSEGSSTSSVATLEAQPLLTNRYAARRMPV